MFADVILLGNAALTAVEAGMDENLQCVGMVGKDVKSTTTDNDTRFLRSDATNGIGLRTEQGMTGLVLFLTVVLGISHVGTIEVGKVIAPQRVASLDFLDGLLNGIDACCHLIQYLLVEQLDT